MAQIIDIKTRSEVKPSEAHRAKRLFQHYTIAMLLTQKENEVRHDKRN